MAAAEQLRQLLKDGALDNARLLSSDGRQLDLPEPIHKALRQIIPMLARGDTITLIPLHRELSTFEAANLLRVSRPHLIKLLEEGSIPYHMAGTHRRMYLQDVLAYDRKRHEENMKLLDEMAALGQELGLYD
jgi:excisionase family DNA binding protein